MNKQSVVLTKPVTQAVQLYPVYIFKVAAYLLSSKVISALFFSPCDTSGYTIGDYHYNHLSADDMIIVGMLCSQI